jgi:DHHC palmitoyltransferase
MIKVSFTNPGHILRSLKIKNLMEDSENPYTKTKNSKKKTKELVKSFLADNKKRLACQDCLVFKDEARKRKIRHCDECGICVEGLDHHCGVLGNCIADRNLRNFNLILGAFLSTVGLAYVSMFIAFCSCGTNAFDNYNDNSSRS